MRSGHAAHSPPAILPGATHGITHIAAHIVAVMPALLTRVEPASAADLM